MHGDPSGLELRGRLGYISVKGQTVLYWTKWMMIVWIPVPIAVIQCTSKDVGGGDQKLQISEVAWHLGIFYVVYDIPIFRIGLKKDRL
jgi:hypothetical protein